MTSPTLHPWLSALPIAAAWTPILPLSWQYIGYLGCAAAAALGLRREAGWRAVGRDPAFKGSAILWCWLLVSAAWSSGSTRDVVAHLWSYSLMLWVVPIAHACTPATAHRGLRHFAAACAVMALFMLARDAAQAVAGLHWPALEVSGNQRIAQSVWLALGASLAVWFALNEPRARQRQAWLGAAALALLALVLQDRRTGVLAAPLLLALLAWAQPPSATRRLAWSAGLAALVIAAVAASGNLQQRFAEGLAELRAYPTQGDVSTSWGMRLRLYEATAGMLAEHPLIGHGVGSWPTEWRRRAEGGPLLRAHSTPHSEWLSIAQQGGLAAVVLAVALMVLLLRQAIGRARVAPALLLVWAAMAWLSVFNAAWRDVKFALPLWLLLALALAENRGPAQPSPP